MKYTFNEEKAFDIVAIGRACIDLNAVEYNRPMEETMTFSNINKQIEKSNKAALQS